jgi:mono/diheme cytochrome c family protein
MRIGILLVCTLTILAGMMALSSLGRVWADDAHAPVDYTTVSPQDLVKNTPKGKLVNPYNDSQQNIVAQGGKDFQRYSCAGCHGGGGGGGMGPPLTNDIWVYGGDDDTLFRLVTLGSEELQKQGYTRRGRESVVGSMMAFGTIIKSSDDLWKMLAFVRSKYSGDPAHKFGTHDGP